MLICILIKGGLRLGVDEDGIEEEVLAFFYFRVDRLT